MRPQVISIAGGLAALALYAAILLGGAASIRGRESAATPDFVLETPDAAAIEEPADQPGRAAEPTAAPTPPPAEAAAKTSRTPVRPVDPKLFAMPEEGLRNRSNGSRRDRLSPRRPKRRQRRSSCNAPSHLPPASSRPATRRCRSRT